MNPIMKGLCALKDCWLSGLLNSYWVIGSEQKAIEVLERLLALRLKYLGKRHDATATAMLELACARAHLNSDEYARSDEMLKEAQRNFVRGHGKYHLKVAWALYCRAWLNEKRENTRAAIKLYTCSHHIYDKVEAWSIDHARVLMQLAALLRREGNKQESRLYEDRAEKILLFHNSASAAGLYMGR